MKVVRTLNVTDIENIAQKVEYRRLQFDEDFMMSLGVVLMNYGDRYVKVICINGEWSGTKADLIPRDGIPLCPNSHPLFEVSTAPRLALIEED
ncbi:MAG: hypothetical protein ABWY25_06340 [Paenisporosarcina sp.]